MDGELFSGASKKMISESSVDARKENWHENMSKGSNFWIIGLSTLGSFPSIDCCDTFLFHRVKLDMSFWNLGFYVVSCTSVLVCWSG